MNTQYWINHYLTNAQVHDALCFDSQTPTTLCEEIRRPLVRSLAIFQLGESGGGSRLRRYAQKTAPLENFRGYQRTIDLFVCEEQAHSRLLARLVRHLGGTLIEKQWTNSIFRGLRFLINLEFAIQVLLTAELIAEVYYGTLYLQVPDPAVRMACRQILKDEMKHLEFQRQFLAERLATFTPPAQVLWKLQFQLVHAVTSRVVAWDHKELLKALGITQHTFVQRCAMARQRFQRRLDGVIFTLEEARSDDQKPAGFPASSS